MLFRMLTIDLLREPRKTLKKLIFGDDLPIWFYIWMVTVMPIFNFVHYIYDNGSAVVENYYVALLLEFVNTLFYIGLFSFFLWLTGKLFKERAEYLRSLRALLIPIFPASLLQALMVIIYSYFLLNSSTDFSDPVTEGLGIFLMLFVFVIIGFAFYSLYIQWVAISVAHRVSVGKAFVMQLVAGVMAWVSYYAIAFIIGLGLFAVGYRP